MNQELEIVIGLEIHSQLMTQSKAFCPSAVTFGAPDNSAVGPVSAGLPGALPVLNQRAVELAVRAGHCLNCRIKHKSVFSRKNYFYPDLPKGYQISQFDLPLCEDGWVEISLDSKTTKRISIERIHMEEDAGKSIHFGASSLLNLNRSGVPLVEIVTRPEIGSAQEAVTFLKKVHSILTFAKVTDGNMEEGNFRCDVNLSLRPIGSKTLGTRTEIKNLNSFRFIEKAIAFEAARQTAILSAGSKVVQETRGWDAALDKTYSLRSKEEAHDYRYFPDPDLPPLLLTEEFIQSILSATPELPDAKKQNYKDRFALSDYDATQLTNSSDLAKFFEASVALGAPAKAAANWILGDLLGMINASGVEFSALKIGPKQLTELVLLVEEKIISGKMAKDIFQEIFISGDSPKQIVETRGLRQISDHSAINDWIEKVVRENPSVVEEFRSGKEKVLSFLVGKVMQLSKGKANPSQLAEDLRKVLKKS